MRTFLKLLMLLIIATSVWCCEKDRAINSPSNEIDVTVKNTESYRHAFHTSGDEERAIIKTQAKHFQTSEIIRDSSTNWRPVYHYEPTEDYAGKDHVEIELCTGGNGVRCSNSETLSINFTVTD